MNSKTIVISDLPLTLEELSWAMNGDSKVELSEKVKTKVNSGRAFLDEVLEKEGKQFYGINSGFGSLYRVKISLDEIEELQTNLVKSHACGTGRTVPQEVVRLILLLKIKNLCHGYSGVRLIVVERLVELFNQNLLPVIYQLGSLGASGDLAPLAHMSLPLLGEGQIWLNNEVRNTSEVLEDRNIEPVSLRAKEGLALLNGTQFSTAYGVWSLIQGEKLLRFADLSAAISIEGFDCSLSPFHPLLHEIRPHRGQVSVSRFINNLLKGSNIQSRKKKHLQDPYSFRCVPQVHGATWDTWHYAKDIILKEVNSTTDNPMVFPDQKMILSGGNFHAQPIALVLDFLAIAFAEIGNISERRIYQLMTGQRGLPEFLVVKPGLHSGLMIAQYTAASIVNKNKTLAVPASTDSIVSSNGQEDHVSMAANSGTKLFEIIENLYSIIGIEMISGFQALEFQDCKSSPAIEKLMLEFREKIKFIKVDRALYKDIKVAKDWLKDSLPFWWAENIVDY